MKHISNSTEETQKIASDFVAGLSLNNYGGNPSVVTASGATVVGLYGDLGAGKTTFTQAVAKTLGVGEIVASPTFVIMKIYEIEPHRVTLCGFNHLIHIDAYRIDTSDELVHLGWQDIISDPKNLILIEWPERVADIMPEHIKINLKHVSENRREIEILE